MAGEWAAERLGEVCREIYRYPSFYGMDRYHDGVPVVRGEHLLPSGWISTDWSEYWFVSEEYSHRFPKTQLEMFDVVMSVRGSIGTFAKVGSAHVGAQISPNLIRLSPDPERVFPAFFYYALRGSAATAFISSTSSSSAVPAIRAADIKLATIPLPPLPEQRAIAHILGTLDDKIELNRRMNETLEGMARALFKSWFVDFDPVRAKLALSGGEGMRGEQPAGLAPHIAALFPDELVETELGLAPRGWEVATIGDLAEIVGGSTPSTKEPEYWEEGTHCWATPKDLSGLSVPVLLETERRVTDAGLARISSGLLPVGTVLLSSRAPIGYLAITAVPVAINQGFIALKPLNIVSNLFLLLWCSFAHDEIMSRANGSTFLEISKANFRPIPSVVPPPEIMAAFDKLARPIYERIVQSERETRSLVTLRDTLLPRLISGELRVADAERIVGRSV